MDNLKFIIVILNASKVRPGTGVLKAQMLQSLIQMLQSLIQMLHDGDFLITDLPALNFGRATEGRRFCYRGYKVTAWLRATPSLPLPEEP